MSYLGNIGATEEILPLVYFVVIFSILAGILGYILRRLEARIADLEE